MNLIVIKIGSIKVILLRTNKVFNIETIRLKVSLVTSIY